MHAGRDRSGRCTNTGKQLRVSGRVATRRKLARLERGPPPAVHPSATARHYPPTRILLSLIMSTDATGFSYVHVPLCGRERSLSIAMNI